MNSVGEGGQGHHEPREMTSGASRYAEIPSCSVKQSLRNLGKPTPICLQAPHFQHDKIVFNETQTICCKVYFN